MPNKPRGKSLHDTNWLAYLRTLALGSNGNAINARLVLDLKGHCPGACRRRVEHLALLPRSNPKHIAAATYRTLQAAIDDLEDMHLRGIQTHAIDTQDNSQRETLNEGCHVRRRVKGNWT